MAGKIVLYYNDLKFQPSESFLQKDFGQVPYVLADLYGMDLEYWISATRPNVAFQSFRGRKVRQFGKNPLIRQDRLDVLRNRALYRQVEREPDVTHFVIFPFTPMTDLAVARRAKRRNAKIILKLDTNVDYLSSLANSWRSHNGQWGQRLTQAWHYRELLRISDLVICETTAAYDMLSCNFLNLDISNKLTKIFSGISEKWFDSLGVCKIPYRDRHNSIIVSGRISSHQKHTETILAAGPPPRGWTIDFIGSIDQNLKDIIDKYRQADPEFDNRYRFHGTITDKLKYYSLLMRAKALLLNSRGGEGFPNVFAEAHKCDLLIVTSDISGAADATNNGKWGIIYAADDTAALKHALNILPDRAKISQGKSIPDDYLRRFIWEYSLDQLPFHRIFENDI